MKKQNASPVMTIFTIRLLSRFEVGFVYRSFLPSSLRYYMDGYTLKGISHDKWCVYKGSALVGYLEKFRDFPASDNLTW